MALIIYIPFLSGYEEVIPDSVNIDDALSYNPWFPGNAIAMTQPIYDEMVEYEDGTVATVSQMSYDVSNFLTWAAEPLWKKEKALV